MLIVWELASSTVIIASSVEICRYSMFVISFLKFEIV